MCLIDNGDGPVTMLSEANRTARKAHKCSECHREITPGETYVAEHFVFDGAFSNHKTCAHCDIVRGWLRAECGGYLFTGVFEDIEGHAATGDYDMGVSRLVVGMRRKWRAPSGRLLPIPKRPMTTEQLLKGHA